MTNPVIISVAITGSVPRKKDCFGLPVTVSEQIEETHKAFEAGASLVHLHVRNPDESPGSNPDQFMAVQEGIRKYCPPMIIQFSTGGPGRNQLERGGHVRTGLEDNIRFDKDHIAKDNAQLVTRVAKLCDQYNRPVATAGQARELLGLRQVH